MALILHLKHIENLKGKADRVAKVTFRGLTYTSKIVSSAKKAAYFGESFEWPIARGVEKDEQLNIELFNHNKYLSNKPYGSYTLYLQGLVENGELRLYEPLVDANNRIMEAEITFDLQYFSPDGQIGVWDQEEFSYPLVDPAEVDAAAANKAGIDDVDQIMPNLLLDGPDDNASLSSYMTDTTVGIPGEDSLADQAMANAERVSRDIIKKLRQNVMDQDLHLVKDYQVAIHVIEGQQLAGLNVDPVVRVQVGPFTKHTSIKQSTNCPYYNEYFVFDFKVTPIMLFDNMISMTVIDATRLPGRNLLKVGNLVAGGVVGTFRCDVGTVYTQPDHRFFHKWAVLLDEKDIAEGPKGYLKCDIVIIAKGDIIKKPKAVGKEDKDLEGNLLLPAGIQMDRQRATYKVNIYRAEGLPRMDTGIMASVKKAITMSHTDFIDAFVRVSFAGHKGRTSIKKDYNPEWKERLTFVDMFPPMSNRMKVQLCDHDALSDDTIATHFIELSQVMDPGGATEGILPTFGPTWVNFYGAPRHYKMVEDLEDLNEGVGEGAAYRGRLLMQIKTELMDSDMGGPSTVYKDKIRSSGKMDVAPKKDFLLFGCLFDASMIDKVHKDKEIYFELSIGLDGNSLDAAPPSSLFDLDSESETDDDEDMGDGSYLLKKQRKKKKQPMYSGMDDSSVDEDDLPPSFSTTEPSIPITKDEKHFFIPIKNDKPCLYIINKMEDLRKRHYHRTILTKVSEQLEEDLDDVRNAIKLDKANPHRKLRQTLSNFISGCDMYTRCSVGLDSGAGAGRTNLDKYRLATCKTNMENLRKLAKEIKKKAVQKEVEAEKKKEKVNEKDKEKEKVKEKKFEYITLQNVREKFAETLKIRTRLKHLAKEPQHSLPDVFLWMIVDKKRIAYQRIPSYTLLHGPTEEVTGKNCGKIQTFFLRRPGKKHMGPGGWAVQCKISILLWLGMRDGRSFKHIIEHLPEGFEPDDPALVHAKSIPPKKLVYKKSLTTFQLRAHVYQARNLIGSDNTGLSDPFARILMFDQCKDTHVVLETLSPTWDETVIFDQVEMNGTPEMIQAHPPLVIIEVFDWDKMGDPEFLGRTMVRPNVHLTGEPYVKPNWPSHLQWWDIYRGPLRAGEVLASFELLEEGSDGHKLPFAAPTLRALNRFAIPLPQEIKPKTIKYRMEVLFWGVREMKRLQLLTVDHPRAEIECAGHILMSRPIRNMKRNMNFEMRTVYLDLDLPENKHYWPPLTIRVVDCRSFGREVLVGTHTITNVTKFIHIGKEERKRMELEKLANRKKLEDENKQQKSLANSMLDLLSSSRFATPKASPSSSRRFLPSINKSIASRDPSPRSMLRNRLTPAPQSLAGDSVSNGQYNHGFINDDGGSMNGWPPVSQLGSVNGDRASMAPSSRYLGAGLSHRKTNRNGDNVSLMPSVAFTSGSKSIAPSDSVSINMTTAAQDRNKETVLDIDNQSLPVNNYASYNGSMYGSVPEMEQTTNTLYRTESQSDVVIIEPQLPGIFQKIVDVVDEQKANLEELELPSAIQGLVDAAEEKKAELEGICEAIMESTESESESPDGPGLAVPADEVDESALWKLTKAELKRYRTKHRSRIADLDWWSKYYITMDDLREEELQQEESEEVETTDAVDDDSKFHKLDLDGGINFDGLNDERMKEARNAKSDSEEEETPREKRMRKLAEKKRKAKEKKRKKRKKAKQRAEKMRKLKSGLNSRMHRNEEEELQIVEEEQVDKSFIERLTVYDTELELVPMFEGFESWIQSYELHRGKKDGDGIDNDDRLAGIFKGTVKFYDLNDAEEEEEGAQDKNNEENFDDESEEKKMDENDNDSIDPMTKIFNNLNEKRKKNEKKEEALALKNKSKDDKKKLVPKMKIFDNLHRSKAFQVLVRVYVVKCMDLHPLDVNGKSDPYLIIKLGNHEVNDKENRIVANLNPVFGRMFEFDATFPMDSILYVSVWDWDQMSADDLIGETRIDLENRFLSKHRASCGLVSQYEIFGYNTWRDPMKPTQILAKLCNARGMLQPEYSGLGKCKIMMPASKPTRDGKQRILWSREYEDLRDVEDDQGQVLPSNEHCALKAIHAWEDTPGGWKVCEEYLERRSLYNPERPGVPQGKVEMWVDMFPKDMPPPPVAQDITPRKALPYELRVVIWNTDEVILEDTNPLTGEASSDIFVRGYLKGHGIDDQQTDVHYRSMSGEGNFNWRFVFKFDYLKAEEVIIFQEEDGVFGGDIAERKIPPKLTLQVWDADLVSADDFLGAVILDLNRIPRPAKDSKNCALKMIRPEEDDPPVPTLNLFLQKRCKGWWPMEALTDGEYECVGKVEAEFSLVTLDEADKAPAGLGREGPEQLSDPNRPDSSFLWMMNPLKTLKYIIWKNYKWTILKILLLLILIAFLCLFFYSVPGVTVKKIFGA